AERERTARGVQSRIEMNTADEPGSGHVLAAADLDVVPAREIELLVVEPPRHVEVRAPGAVLVVRDLVHHARNEPGQARARRVRQIPADIAAGIAEALGELRRLGVEE